MKKFAKLAAALLVVAFVFAAALPAAKAASVAELQAMIEQLKAQLAQMGGSSAGSTVGSDPFETNLKLGSKGDDVERLQNFLEEKGLLDTNGVYGYFGAKTKAAVIKYQKENDITPASGNFGPLTRAAVNDELAAAEVVVTTPSTPSTPSTPATTLDDTDGSLTTNIKTSPADNQTIKMGETKDVLAVELKANNGKVAVNRIDVHTNVRPWLYFTKLQLVDDKGTVVAESDPSKASENTVGSDYLVRFDGLNFVVDPAATTKPSLTVRVTAVNDTSRSNPSGGIKFAFQSGSIRTINGKSYTETIGANGAVGWNGSSFTADRSITFSSATVGNLIVTLDSASPSSGQLGVSSTTDTDYQTVGIVNLRAENRDVTLNTIKVTLRQSDTDSVTELALFDNAGNRIGSADQLTGTSTFTNLNFKVLEGVSNKVALTLKAKFKAQGGNYAEGSTVYVTVIPEATAFVGTDALYNSASVTGSNFSTNAMSLYVKGVKFARAGGQMVVQTGTSGSVAKADGYISFTVTAGDYDVFLMKGAVATTTTSVGSSTPVTGVTVYTDASSTGTSLNLDYDAGASYQSSENGTYTYKVPANASRTFRVNIGVNNTSGTAGFKNFQLVGFGWNTSDSLSSGSYTTSSTYDLSALKVTSDKSIPAS